MKRLFGSFKKSVQFSAEKEASKTCILSEKEISLLRGAAEGAEGSRRNDKILKEEIKARVLEPIDRQKLDGGGGDLRILFARQKQMYQEMVKERDAAIKHNEELETRNAELTKLLGKLTFRMQGLAKNEDVRSKNKTECGADDSTNRLSADSNSSEIQAKFLANLNEENLKRYKSILKRVKLLLRVRSKSEIPVCVEELSIRAKWQKGLLKNLMKILQINCLSGVENGYVGSQQSKSEMEEAKGAEIEAKVKSILEQNKSLKKGLMGRKITNYTTQPQVQPVQNSQLDSILFSSGAQEEPKIRESFGLEEKIKRIKTILDK